MVRLKVADQQQNANVEKSNRTVRYEGLKQYYWLSLEESQEIATRWLWSYNNDHPNMKLGGFKPKQKLAMPPYRFYF